MGEGFIEEDSSIFDRVLQVADKNRKRAESGLNNCIPFGFPRFEEYLPGVEMGKYYNITASSGIGKSKICDHMFLYSPYDFITGNKGTDITVKIFYYSLEMDKTTKIFEGCSRWLYLKYGIRASKDELRSIKKSYLKQEVYEKMMEARSYFENLEDICHFHDYDINPYGIFKTVKEYMLDNGKEVKKTINIKGEDVQVFDYYKPNKENHYVILIVDHISLLTPESGMSLHDTIGKFSAKDCVQLRNKYGVSPVIVQQQAAYKEEQQFTFKGQSIESKLQPSLDALGDNKKTQRDNNVVLGLFAPNRYEIEDYKGYNIAKFQDNFRVLSVLKNRDGSSNVRIGLYFDGAVNVFKELPRPDNVSDIDKYYDLIKQIRK